MELVGINISMCKAWEQDNQTKEIFSVSTGYVVNWQHYGAPTASSKVFVEPRGVLNFVAELLGVPIKKREKHGTDRPDIESAAA